MYFHSCQSDGQRGESLHCNGMLLPAHNKPAGWQKKRERERGGEGIYVCYTVEEVEEVEVAGKFVPSQELLSLSLGHTWFHQGARPSFIIDANLFRAD